MVKSKPRAMGGFHRVLSKALAATGTAISKSAKKAIAKMAVEGIGKVVQSSNKRARSSKSQSSTQGQGKKVQVVEKKKRRRGIGTMPSGPIHTIKSGKKVTKSDPLRVTLKVEKGFNFVGWHAIYPGGVTHPSSGVLRMISYAIIRFMMKQAKIDFGNWDDLMVVPTSVQDARIAIRIFWKTEGQGNSALAQESCFSSSLGTRSFENYAQLFASRLISTFSNALTEGSRRLVGLSIGPEETDDISQNFISAQYYHASDLYVSVKGESTLQVQNRTLADGGTNATDSDNIFNNPLRGKYYTFARGRPVIRNVGSGDTATSRTYFPYFAQNGIIAQQDRFGAAPGGSNFSENVSKAIRKPPNGVFFTNCKTTKMCQVLPGAIMRSRIEHDVTHNVATWMNLFRSKFQSTTSKTIAGLDGTEDPSDYTVGVAHMYGLEKMVDTDLVNDNQLQIGHEHNLFMSSKAMYRPKSSVVSIVQIDNPN